MSRLMDIKGYWNEHSPNFNEMDMWEGKLLLDDNGWFEGIVRDSNSSYTGDRMIFGTYYPTAAIELLKVSPPNVSDPFVFRGNRDAKGYDGEFSVLGIWGEIPFGVSHIITQDVELAKDNGYTDDDRDIDKEIVELLEKIAAFKAKGYNRELYENTLAAKEQIAKVVLARYARSNGWFLSDEDIAELRASLKEVDAKTRKDTMEAVKKYGSYWNKGGLPKDYFDLPF